MCRMGPYFLQPTSHGYIGPVLHLLAANIWVLPACCSTEVLPLSNDSKETLCKHKSGIEITIISQGEGAVGPLPHPTQTRRPSQGPISPGFSLYPLHPPASPAIRHSQWQLNLHFSVNRLMQTSHTMNRIPSHIIPPS